jgi:hypothetical protein
MTVDELREALAPYPGDIKVVMLEPGGYGHRPVGEVWAVNEHSVAGDRVVELSTGMETL